MEFHGPDMNFAIRKSAGVSRILPCVRFSWLALAVASGTAALAAIPQPVTTHPRLWITQSDLPRLRSWATSANPIYQQGLLPVLARAITDYNACFPDGVTPASPYPDPGDTQGYTPITPGGGLTEQDAEIFALHSLIDPVPANRLLYAQHARNLMMHAMNEAAKGVLSNEPFRDPLFPTYNRANLASQAWPLTVDWIYSAVDANNQPVLTAQDKATIRNVFLIWANECLNAHTTGGDHPSPIGAVNSLSLLPSGNAYRMAANNYFLGHARLLTMMSLAMDPSDDPAIDPSTPLSTLGNSLRSYIANATGGWLYQEYAMFGEPAAVRSAYGLSPGASVGLASGGMPAEGMLYGHSIGYVLGQLLAIKTSGFADPTLSGPQAALANSAPVWGRFSQAFASSLVPVSQIPTPPASFNDPIHQIDSTESYLGNVYEMASYGDILRMYVTPDFVEPFALAALLDQQNGDTSRLSAERWFVVNALQGGPSQLLERVSNPWAWGVEDSLLTFLLLDPAAAPDYSYPDPRPAYATAYFDALQGRLVEHYPDWSETGTMFDYRCSWNSINHQQNDANQFELFRNGEWLTKGLANYDNNWIGQSTDYHNTLSLKNWCANGTPAGLEFWEVPLWSIGSQWSLDANAGDPTAATSVAAAYTYAYGDTTNLYNLPNQYSPGDSATDITHASRSLLWLKPDYVVVYDRATSLHTGLPKRFNLTVVGTPGISGNMVTTTTPGGQHLYVNSLLPATGTKTITSSSLSSSGISTIADLEPSTDRIVIEDTAHPADVRFLHVLQGADAGTAAAPTSLIQSTSGTAFDGAVVANSVIMFRRDMTTPFTNVTFSMPTAGTPFYVTGLTPNAGYALSQVGTVVTVTPGGASVSDSAGVLVGPVAASGPVAPWVTSQPAGQTVLPGNNATFGVQAAGTAPLAYRWQRLPSGGSWANLNNSSVYAGTATATLTVNGATAVMNGDQFRCVVSGVSPNATSNTATLTVLPALSTAPVITTQPLPQAVVAGANATYSVAAIGQGTLSYQWQQSNDGGSTWIQLLYGGSYWDGGSSSVLTLNAVTAAMSGEQFQCVVSNGTNPDATSSAMTLVVLPALPLAPTIATQPASQTVAAGGNADFRVVAAGTAPLTDQWQLSMDGGNTWANLTDTAPYSGTATGSLTITGVTIAMNGNQYRCLVSNSVQNDVPSNAAILTVSAPVVPTADPAQSVISSGFTASWSSVSGATGCRLDVSSDSSFNSFISGYQDLDVGNVTSTTVSGLSANTIYYYRVRAYNSAGAGANSGTITVTTSAAIVVTAPLIVSTLAGQPLSSGDNDGTGSSARFYYPSGIAADNTGNLYIADTDNHTIRKIVAASGAVTTLAGLAGSSGSADGTGSDARFNGPSGVAVDGAGNVYVADSLNNLLRKVTASGVVSTLAGSPGTAGGADGTGSDALFHGPQGLAIDAGGNNLYVADTNNHTIRNVVPSTGVVTTLSGLAGNSGSVDGPGNVARFSYPSGVAVDRAGNLYVADTGNHTIRVIPPSGLVSTLAGLAGSSGGADGTGSAARFDSPSDVAVDSSGNLYVADTDNFTIRKVVPSTGVVSTLAGLAGTSGSADGLGSAVRFFYPAGIAVDSSSNLYVADTNNHTVRLGLLPVAPAIQTQPQSQTVIAGASVQFTVTASGRPAVTYQWYFGGAAISGATGNTYSFSNAQSVNAGNYAVVVSNVVDSVTSNAATLTVTSATPPPSGGGGGGGGGAPSAWFCGALFLLAAIRMRSSARFQSSIKGAQTPDS